MEEWTGELAKAAKAEGPNAYAMVSRTSFEAGVKRRFQAAKAALKRKGSKPTFKEWAELAKAERPAAYDMVSRKSFEAGVKERFQEAKAAMQLGDSNPPPTPKTSGPV